MKANATVKAKSRSQVLQDFRMQISVAGTNAGFESTASRAESSSHGDRLITIHRPESRRLILLLLNSCNFSENSELRRVRVFFSNLHAR